MRSTAARRSSFQFSESFSDQPIIQIRLGDGALEKLIREFPCRIGGARLLSRNASRFVLAFAAPCPTRKAFAARTRETCAGASFSASGRGFGAGPMSDDRWSCILRASFRTSCAISIAPSPGLVAFVAGFQAGAVDGLFERVAGQDAESHRHAGIELRELNAARGFRCDVIVVGGLATQDAADADDRIEATGRGKFFRRQRNLKRAGNANNLNLFFAGSGALEARPVRRRAAGR